MHIKIEPKRITQTYRCTSTHEDGKFDINQQLKKGFPLYNLILTRKKWKIRKKINTTVILHPCILVWEDCLTH